MHLSITANIRIDLDPALQAYLGQADTTVRRCFTCTETYNDFLCEIRNFGYQLFHGQLEHAPDGKWFTIHLRRHYSNEEQHNAEIARLQVREIAWSRSGTCPLEPVVEELVIDAHSLGSTNYPFPIGLGTVGERLMLANQFKERLQAEGLNLRFEPVVFDDPWEVYTSFDPDPEVCNDPEVIPHPYWYMLPTATLPPALNAGEEDYQDELGAWNSQIEYGRRALEGVGEFDLAIAHERITKTGQIPVVYLTSRRLRQALNEMAIFNHLEQWEIDTLHQPCLIHEDK
jgi:hypothetical protein